MKEKIKKTFVRLRLAIRQHPVEVLLSVVFSLAGCFYAEKIDGSDFLAGALAYFPVLFLITYTLNRVTVASKLRPLYFLSVFFFIPFLWLDKENLWKPTYLVSLVVVQLVYLISYWKRENDAFTRIGLHYLRALLSAGLLSGVAWVLALSVNASIQYIFEVWEGSSPRFSICLASLAFMCGMPLLFLMFNQEEEEEENRLFEILLNYVLSPVLLVYAVILYLYFIKITVLWSLPKGAVAYIVVSFIFATFVLKGCQVFLTKNYYSWFYNAASLLVLPALIMFWVGTSYRINQYGFTEPRVYLVVVGMILTGLVLLFLTKRWGRYLYAACLAVAFLSAVTYIPGVTAKDIERISQTKRGNYPFSERVDDKHAYFYIQNEFPVDISGYTTLERVETFKKPDQMWMKVEQDSFSIFIKADELLYSEALSVFWNNQLMRAGLNPGDSIPQHAFPVLLEFEMDSAKLILQSISLQRSASDSVYEVSYITPACYLKK